MSTFEASELTLNSEGKVYHLGLGPDDIASTIILVGDQDRVKFIGTFSNPFDSKRKTVSFARSPAPIEEKNSP